MSQIETAISIQKHIFYEIEQLALQLGISQDELFSIAISEFLDRHKNRDLFPNEKILFSAMKEKQRKLLENEW